MGRLRKAYIIFAVLILMAAAGFFFVGRASVKKDGSDVDRPPCCTVTFYATIEELNGRNFRVQGLDVNDINHRGRFDFYLDEDATIWKGYLEVSIEKLNVGDMVEITYYGDVWQTNPAYINGVTEVRAR